MKLFVFLILVVVSIALYNYLFKLRVKNLEPKHKLLKTLALGVGAIIGFVGLGWLIFVFSAIWQMFKEIEKSNINLPYYFPWSDFFIIFTLYVCLFYTYIQWHKRKSSNIAKAYNRGIMNVSSDLINSFLKGEKTREEIDDFFYSNLDKYLLDQNLRYDKIEDLNDSSLLRKSLTKDKYSNYKSQRKAENTDHFFSTDQTRDKIIPPITNISNEQLETLRLLYQNPTMTKAEARQLIQKIKTHKEIIERQKGSTNPDT